MKNSGIEWIGEIPDCWELQPLRGHLIEIKESNDPIQTTQVLSLTNKLGVIPYEEKGEQGNKSKENYNEYKLAYPNTIVANSMNILIGSVGICNYFGCVSPVYYVFKPKDEQELKFLDYIFQSQPFQKELRKYAKGILEIRLRVSANDILRRQVAFPSSQQQKKIVDFLEAKLNQVDELIANQQGQIEKLKEYKQSVITEAVTKGLDKSAPLKDSGIEWIGEIPASWRYLKSAYVYNKIGDIDHCMPASVNDGYPYVMTGDLHGFASEINFEACKKVSKIDYEQLSRKISPNRGDIIFARYATIGTVCYVDIDKDFLASYSCVTIKPKTDRVNGKYLWRYYQSLVFLEEVKKLVNSNTQANVGIDSLYRANLVIPPLPEQQQIVDYLDEKCGKIDRIIAIKQEKIEKLQEYKKSLIYEYVTGKKEVV